MRLTDKQWSALKAISSGDVNAVLWPGATNISNVKLYGTGRDGRIHYEAPVDDVFALLDAKMIDKRGVITDLGRAALAQSVEKK